MYLHVHNGEQILYEDTCPVCANVDDTLNIERIPALEGDGDA